MRAAARTRIDALVRNAVYASVDRVPVYEWRTPLQRAIQILKRHRDVMFRNDPDGKPISMIVTTLSAHAYQGETDLHAALGNIVEAMPDFVRPNTPRIPNPVNPAEDFADKWAKKPTLEDNFWAWHKQVGADLANLQAAAVADELQKTLRRRFALEIGEDRLAAVIGATAVSQPIERPPKPVVHISTPLRPWEANA